jgi:hypothetical protein
VTQDKQFKAEVRRYAEEHGLAYADARRRVLAERERIVHENPELAQQIREGVEEAEAGQTVYLGSFAQYLDDEEEPGA